MAHSPTEMGFQAVSVFQPTADMTRTPPGPLTKGDFAIPTGFKGGRKSDFLFLSLAEFRGYATAQGIAVKVPTPRETTGSAYPCIGHLSVWAVSARRPRLRGAPVRLPQDRHDLAVGES